MENGKLCPVAFRCYLGNSVKSGSWNGGPGPSNSLTVVIDTETSTREGQELLHGVCDVWIENKLHETFLFYGDGLNREQIEIIIQHGAMLGCKVLSRKDFVEKVFFPYVYHARAKCVGFNLKFDLSRLVIRQSESKKKRYKNGFSLVLSEDDRLPNIVVKSISSKASFIEFTKPSKSETEKKYEHFQGCFTDLRAACFALTNGEIRDESGKLLSLNLENYAGAFGCKVKKTKPKKFGEVSPENIDYNINDTRLTHELLQKTQARFDLYHLEKDLSDLYSPASIGKAYIEKFGIKSFLDQNPDFPERLLGNTMNCYYGGKTQAHWVKEPVPVGYLDATSMYPTSYSLLHLDTFLKAKKILHSQTTGEIQALLATVTLADIAKKEFWADGRLITICKIAPDYDLFPLRSRYGASDAWTIGLNYVKSVDGTAGWWTLLDLIASKILTGKTPIIQEAVTFVPIGVQEGLKDVEILPGVTVKPEENWIRKLIDERIKLKKRIISLQGEEKKQASIAQNILKIIANSACYGIFIEINPTPSEAEQILVHGLEDFTVEVDIVEKEGKAFNPILGVTIPAAARLLLAAAEAVAERNGGYVAYTDTESIFVSPDLVSTIQQFFRGLNPYSEEIELFKIEKDANGKDLDNVLLYAISSKRYVLYERDESTGKITIRKYSSHGLGYLEGLDEEKWWTDILEIYYYPDRKQQVLAKYEDRYAHLQLSINSYDVYKRFRHFNQGKPTGEQIKPFNFITVGLGYRLNPKTQEPIIPMLPYVDKNRRGEIPFLPFTDYRTGDKYPNEESLPTEYHWKPLSVVMEEFLRHPESKFEGAKGRLRCRHVTFDRSSVHYIGKESNNLEIAVRLGDQGDTLDYTAKRSPTDYLQEYIQVILDAKPKDVKPFGISRQTLWEVKQSLRTGKLGNLKKKVVKRLIAFLVSSHSK